MRSKLFLFFFLKSNQRNEKAEKRQFVVDVGVTGSRVGQMAQNHLYSRHRRYGASAKRPGRRRPERNTLPPDLRRSQPFCTAHFPTAGRRPVILRRHVYLW